MMFIGIVDVNVPHWNWIQQHMLSQKNIWIIHYNRLVSVSIVVCFVILGEIFWIKYTLTGQKFGVVMIFFFLSFWKKQKVFEHCEILLQFKTTIF